MTSPTADPRPPTEKPTAYRGASALIGGALVVLFCGIGAIDLIVESGTQDLTGASILLLVAILAALYGVYPAAFAWSDRLVVRNPFRTIELPWAAVTDLSARLSFMAHTETRRFTVWAIPVSLRERRRSDRHRLRDLSQAQRAAKRGASAELFQPSRGRHPVDPIDRLSFADQAIAEMNARREAHAVQLRLKKVTDVADGGQARPESAATADSAALADPATAVDTETTAPVDSATARWSWLSFGLLGAAVILLIVALSLR